VDSELKPITNCPFFLVAYREKAGSFATIFHSQIYFVFACSNSESSEESSLFLHSLPQLQLTVISIPLLFAMGRSKRGSKRQKNAKTTAAVARAKTKQNINEPSTVRTESPSGAQHRPPRNARKPKGQVQTSARKEPTATEMDSDSDEGSLSGDKQNESPAKRTRARTSSELQVADANESPAKRTRARTSSELQVADVDVQPRLPEVADPLMQITSQDTDDESDGSESGDDPNDPPANHSGESDAEPPTLKITNESSSTKTRRRITKGGEDKYWMSATREAVRDCRPNRNKAFILYLPQTPDNTGSKMIIESDIQLQELALTRGGVQQYSKEKASLFNEHHRKAKTQLNRSLVLALTTDGPFQIAMNVRNGKNGPMMLHPDFSHLVDVPGLRALLNSDKLYCDDKVHRLWVELFQSGLVSGTKRVGPRETLDTILDVNYEAHARYEMILRLGYQGYKQGYTATASAERSAGFRLVRKLVRKDRINNLKAAEEKRLSMVTAADDDVSRSQALASGALADTTDEEDNF
jgi:hypothetical protein